MDISVITEPVIKLFIAIFIGFVSVKTGYLEADMRNVLSKIIIKITLPLMIITSLLSKELNGDTAINVTVAAASAMAVMTVLFFGGLGTARLFRLKEPTKMLHAVLSGSGNVGFLGYPVALAVFGAEGLFYAVIYGMVNDAIFWTAGVYLINRSAGTLPGKQAVKKLVNPNTVAFLIGIPLLFFGVKLPPVLNDAFTGIGSVTTYMSMLFIGMTLATIDIKSLYKRVSMVAPAVIKMIIAPILAAVLLVRFGISHVTVGAVVLEIAMPAQTVASIVAMDAGSDEKYAAEYIFFSTLLSLVTLPLIYYVMGKIMM